MHHHNRLFPSSLFVAQSLSCSHKLSNITNTYNSGHTSYIHKPQNYSPTMMNLLQHTRQLSVRSLMGGSISSRRTSATEQKSTSKKTSTRKRRPKSSTAAAATMKNSSTIPVNVSSGESSAETEKTACLELSQSSISHPPQHEQQEHRRRHRKHRSKKSLLDKNSSTRHHHQCSRRLRASKEQEVPKQPRQGLLPMGGSSRSYHAVYDPNASCRSLLSSKQERSRRNVRKGLESSSDLIASMWSSHQELPLMNERQQQRQKGPPITTHGRRGLAKALSVPALVSSSSTASTSDAPKLPPSTSYKKGTTTTSSSKKAKPKTGNTFMSRLRDEMVQPPHRPAPLPHHTASSCSREIHVKPTTGWSHLVHVPTNEQHCRAEPHQPLQEPLATPPPEMDLLVHRPADHTTSPENTVNGITNSVTAAVACVVEGDQPNSSNIQATATPPSVMVAPQDNSLFCIGMIIEVPEDFDGSDI